MDPSAVAAPPDPQLYVDSLGALELAIAGSNISMGIVMVLAWSYFLKYRQGESREMHHLLLKLYVLLNVAFAVADTSFNIAWQWKWTVEYYGYPQGMGILPWQLKINIPLISSASVLVQAFYIYRLYVLSGGSLGGLQLLYPAVLAAGALMAWGFGIYSGVRVSNKTAITDFALIIPKVYGWFVGALVVDVLITAGTAYHLIYRPAKVSGKQLAFKSPLAKIMRRAAQTNVIAATWQLLAMAVFLARQDTQWHSLFGSSLIKIYVASLLGTLNARKGLGGNIGSAGVTSSTGEAPSRRYPLGAGTGVNVKRDVVTLQDHAFPEDDPSPHNAVSVRFEGAGPWTPNPDLVASLDRNPSDDRKWNSFPDDKDLESQLEGGEHHEMHKFR
ncbi:hypothetical protein JCM6882_001061 [Rhodosporidiobolus microsporus]